MLDLKIGPRKPLLKGVCILAEIIHTNLQSVSLCEHGRIRRSMGAGKANSAFDSVDACIEYIDEALYSSRRNGRNRITVLSGEDPSE